MINLSKRLSMNISLLTPCKVLADVGCDHAYSSIYACKSGLAENACAMDLREGPLKKADINIKEYGLSDRIKLVLCDGLTGIKPGDCDAILISGMGGMLMRRILEECKDTVMSAKQVIVQPQSDIGLVRHFFHENGMTITDDRMTFEDGKYYQCFRAVMGAEEAYPDECYYEYGRCLIDSNDSLLKEFLHHRLERIAMVEDKMGENFGEASNAYVEKQNVIAALSRMEEI